MKIRNYLLGCLFILITVNTYASIITTIDGNPVTRRGNRRLKTPTLFGLPIIRPINSTSSLPILGLHVPSEGMPWSPDSNSSLELYPFQESGERSPFPTDATMEMLRGKDDRKFVTVIIDEVVAETYDVWIYPVHYTGHSGEGNNGCNVVSSHIVWVGSCLLDSRDIIDLPVPQDKMKKCIKMIWNLYPEHTVIFPKKHIEHLECNRAKTEIGEYQFGNYEEMYLKYMPNNFQNIYTLFDEKIKKFRSGN